MPRREEPALPVIATRRFVLGAAVAAAAAGRAAQLVQPAPAQPYAGGSVVEGEGVRTTVLVVTDDAFGARGDGVLLNDLSVSAGSRSISSATAPFTSTQVDRGKIVYWLGTDDRVGTGVIDSVQSGGSATLRQGASVGSRADGGPNTNGGFGSDNTAAFDAAFESAQAAAARVSADLRVVVPRVEVHVPRGVFFTRPLRAFQQSGVLVTGEGRFTSLIASGAEGAWISMSEYDAAPQDAFGGTATDWTFRDLHFVNPCYRSGSTEGKRAGTAIQDNGSGGVRLLGCAFTGLSYGFCGAYGSDFSQLRDCNFYLCDTGYYFGPGGQQIDIAKTDAALCREGAVFEGAPQWRIGDASSFEDPSVAAVTIQGSTSGTTRLGVPVALSGAFYSGTFLIEGAVWFETNSGGNGRLCPRMILVKGDGPFGVPVEGVAVRDAYLIAGGKQVTGGTNCFLEYDSGLVSDEPVLIENLRVGGDFINSVFRMSGSASTSRPRLVAVNRPKGVSLLQGPTSGAKVLERDGSLVWPLRISAPSGSSPLVLEPGPDPSIPVLAVQQSADAATTSGIASGGALLDAYAAGRGSGAVDIDASRCNYFSFEMTGTVTSMRIRNAPASSSQRLTVELRAPSAARSVRWPDDCRFAGGAPARVDARTRTSVTFSWDPGAHLWVETARATGVGL